MDKIKQLMVESGLSEEAATKICESMETWKTSEKQKLDEQFKQRLDKAKKVCMEETAQHKRELSRRFQIFVEARQQAIEESIRKQAIDKETEAAATLEKVHRLLEGFDFDGQPNSELKARLQKVEAVCERLQEERDKAVSKANQSVNLAEKVMERNRHLERALQESKRQPAGQQPVTEGRQSPGQKRQRLDEGRQGGQPRTTRPTVANNQNANQPAQQRQGNTQTMVGPAQIAEDMDAQL